MLSVRNVYGKFNPAFICKLKTSIRCASQINIPILFGDEVSPPVRFVKMTAFLLGVELKFHKIDLFLGENKSEFYTKINPLQKVPALCTGDLVICDSHAIALYLCRVSKNFELYPEDPLKRALVEQVLFFNSSSLFPADSLILSEYFAGKPIDGKKVEHWNQLLDYLDGQLKIHPWLAGSKMTLCDLCCGATVSSMQLLLPLTHRHLKVVQWMMELQQQPCFEINTRGIQRLARFITSK